jgi:hypothetical protein
LTSEDLIQSIQEAYRTSNKDNALPPKVYRGTKAPVSAYAEDQFARYLRSKISPHFEIWIDSQIRHQTALKDNSTSHKRLFRPDICIVDGGEVKMVFEIKIDLGFIRRTIETYLSVRDKELEIFKNGPSHCKIKGKEPVAVSFDACPPCNFIIFSPDYSTIAKIAGERRNKTIFILGKNHPNDDPPDYIAQPDAFTALEDKLNKTLNGKRSKK